LDLKVEDRSELWSSTPCNEPKLIRHERVRIRSATRWLQRCRKTVVHGVSLENSCAIEALTRPLQVVIALKAWLRNLAKNSAWLFPAARGSRLSADAVQRLLAKYKLIACRACPSLKKKRVTPHGLRPTLARELLQAGLDRSGIALWLGHESVETTQIYLEANLKPKEKVLAWTNQAAGRCRLFKPGDPLLAFLKSLSVQQDYAA
jgi:hypothetical protein